jgi:hypothetical protein
MVDWAKNAAMHSANEVKIPRDTSAGLWIAPRLTGKFGRIDALVPLGYEAYVRVFHPATTPSDQAITWKEVARETGFTISSTAQWHRLVGASDPEGLTDAAWLGVAPEKGSLPVGQFEALSDVLQKFTGTPEDCSFGVWRGQMWREASDAGGAGAGIQRSIEDVKGPVLSLRTPVRRDYLLLTGPLVAATKLAAVFNSRRILPILPDLVWPSGQEWFLRADVDLDSTLLGGSLELVQAIVRSDKLESLQIRPEDSIAAQ